MAAIGVSFRWLDLLEKEFDKAYVDLELLIGEFFAILYNLQFVKGNRAFSVAQLLQTEPGPNTPRKFVCHPSAAVKIQINKR